MYYNEREIAAYLKRRYRMAYIKPPMVHQISLSLFFSQPKGSLMQRYYERTYITMHQRKSYGFWKFAGDILMTCLTGGLWLIWIFVREMRRR